MTNEDIPLEFDDEPEAEVLEFKPRLVEGETTPPAGEGLDIPNPEFHTLLEVWKEVLAPALKERTAHVTPQWAVKMTGLHQGLTFADMNDFRDLYYGRLLELYDMLLEVIDGDPLCLTYVTAEEDVENNSQHYRDLLEAWQLRVLQWELDWDCESPTAALELASISEVHKIYFSSEGITPWLDQIKFVYTEADQGAVAEKLEAMKEEANRE